MLYWLWLQGLITSVVLTELAIMGGLAFLVGIPWAVGLQDLRVEA